MIATALLPLMFLTPAAEEPEPIDAAFVEVMIGTGLFDETCVAYGGMIESMGDMLHDYSAMETFVGMADAYVIVTVEGDAFRFSNDARDYVTDWLHSDCS